jgi:hypothetical protein
MMGEALSCCSHQVTAGRAEPRERTCLAGGLGEIGGETEHLLTPTKSRGFRDIKPMLYPMMGVDDGVVFHPFPPTPRQHAVFASRQQSSGKEDGGSTHPYCTVADCTILTRI